MAKNLLPFLLLLGVSGLSGLSAAETRAEVFAQTTAKAWATDGVTVQTGFAADGTQNLAVLAKGGYFPVKVTAKAGVKSVLRVYTNKTNDCSRVFTIPSLKVQAVLPPKGYKEFPIPAMAKGQTLRGVCGMGMYEFEIEFTE